MTDPDRRRRLARSPNLAEVRFIVDEDLAGLGLALMSVRNDVVVGSQPPVRDLVPRKDRDWIPVVTDHGWVVITNDRRIRTRPDEAQPAIDHGLRCAHLAPVQRDATRWDFLKLLISHWDAVEGLCDERGPVWLRLRGHETKRLDYAPGQPPRLPSASRSRSTDV